MKRIYSFLITVALMLGVTACGDNWNYGGPKEDGEGQVSLSSLGVDVSNAENVVGRDGIDLSDFIVTVTNAKGEKQAEWTYAAMPDVFTLPVGENYTVTVKNREVEKAAWDAPFYKGAKTFNIKNGEVTEIGVVKCTLSNIKVTIIYDESLLKKIGADAKVIVKANDEGSLDFLPTETRSGYFEALEGSSTLVAEFNGIISDENVTYRKIYTDVAPGTHYRITFKLSTNGQDIPDEGGFLQLENGLRLDVSVTVVDVDGNIVIDEDVIDGQRPGEGNDDPQPDPGVQTITFSSNTLSFTGINDPNDPALAEEAIVNIHADNGIEHLMVHIESNSADFIASAGEMVPFDFDLAYPTVDGVDWSDKLGPQGLQFPVGDEVIGKNDVVFDITQFAFLLGAFPGTHQFTITVTDGKNVQASRTLTFVAQ